MSQHRLCRVQLVNWGTFDGARSFAVPRRGLLLTGPSGAGKSSILDAMASILVRPAKLKFNSAAQKSGRHEPLSAESCITCVSNTRTSWCA